MESSTGNEMAALMVVLKAFLSAENLAGGTAVEMDNLMVASRADYLVADLD